MAFLVLQQLLEKFHGPDIAGVEAGIGGFPVKFAGAVFSLKVALQDFLDVFADGKRI